jgi:hypothetical protein
MDSWCLGFGSIHLLLMCLSKSKRTFLVILSDGTVSDLKNEEHTVRITVASSLRRVSISSCLKQFVRFRGTINENDKFSKDTHNVLKVPNSNRWSRIPEEDSANVPKHFALSKHERTSEVRLEDKRCRIV